MKIYLLNPDGFTRADVKALIASWNDSVDWQLRVTKDGFAYMSHIIGRNELEGVAFYAGAYMAGKGFSGPTAASDPQWIEKIYQVLMVCRQRLLKDGAPAEAIFWEMEPW